jgi:hypothetical protein
MTARLLNESTSAWLERLVSSNATDSQIRAVTAILENERQSQQPGKKCELAAPN